MESKDIKKSIKINEIYKIEIKDDEELENIELKNIDINKVKELLKPKEKGELPRIIYENISIRNGQYGDYIFYKKASMKKPKFLKLNGFIKENGANSYKTCDIDKIRNWIYNTYDLQ